MVHEFRDQPFKGIYLFYEAIATVFLRLPFWVACSIPKGSRPRESWTLKKAVTVRLLAHLYNIINRADKLIHIGDHLSVTKGLNVKHVWVEPTRDLMNAELRGWAEAGGVEPISIPGYWLDKNNTNIAIGAPPQPGEKVIYALHGGAYISLSASPDDVVANIVRGLLKHCRPVRRVFAIEYRLSKAAPGPAENPFPAALLDVLAGYVYLTQTVGVAPENIVVEGDSAGGGLALALARYLVENAGLAGLPPPPGALVLLSPWGDLTMSDVHPGSSVWTNQAADYIGHPSNAGSIYARNAYLGPLGPYDSATALNRYISPASTDPTMQLLSFKGFPRTLVVAGEAEVMRTQIRTLYERMGRDMGEGEEAGQVSYYESPDSVHDFLVLTFHEPERTQTLKVIAEWLGE